MNYKHLLLFVGLTFGMASCDRLLEFEPGDVILAEDAINDAEDLQRLLVSTYDVVANLYGGRVQIVNELRGPNFGAPDNSLDFTAVYNRETTFFTGINAGIYTDFYYAIYRSNVVIENFQFVQDLNEVTKTRLEAEARFVRAICHWGAVKLFARPYGYSPDNSHNGVPLRLESSQDPLPRATVAAVYSAIVSDLQFDAENLPASNGVYATQLAAQGYLAQVHFLMGQYDLAAAYATNVINSGQFQLDEDLDRFETDLVNTETVFGIVSQPNDFRSSWYRDNLRSDNTSSPQLAFSDDFAFFMSLSGGGDSRSDWYTAGTRALCNRFNNKEYFNIPLVHLTMLHLIRSEALAETETDLTTAIADINVIRTRAFGAGNNDLDAESTAEEIRDAARDEYRKETAAEGHWTDQLLRRGTMGEQIIIRDAPWDCPGMSLQFSNTETTVQGFDLNEEGGCL
ncbi:MAG: RagB/SusD family nutrient uptake outer membrane protein [Flavobacteriales bacterium]|nr:RagB/SusD family nutrient uptake outer membrane protein [Flavobacteriales bacterium]